MKTKFLAVLFATVFLISALGMASATPGSIKTTTSDCNSPVDVNHYVAGETVYIHGSNFANNANLPWDITGNPGGSSCEYPSSSDRTVAEGTVLTDSTGAFCFAAHEITPSECGEYKATVNGKQDNYRVDVSTPVVPEFGLITGLTTVLAAVGVLFFIRRH